MTEKELREFAKETAGQYAPPGVRSLCRSLLEKDPDLVWLLRWAYEELEHAGGGGEECAFMRLRDRLEEQVQLTPDGWEYTDEAADTEGDMG